MKIKLVLEVDDPSLIDENHKMGITEEAYEALMDALPNLGFAIDSGPDRLPD